MRLTSEQVTLLGELGKRYPGGLDVEPSGPLLKVQVYVQSASSSGYTNLYYTKAGKKVDA